MTATTGRRPSTATAAPDRLRLPVAAAVPVALAGAVVTAAGVGLALPWLRLAGLGAAGVASLALLALGLVLLVTGVTALLRRARGWWRRTTVVVAGAVALLLSLAVVGQAVAAAFVPPTRVGTATPATYGLDYREVHPVTADGVRLAGWYVPSRNGSAVVLLHGAHSTRSAVLRHGVVLARDGFGVLLLDARGHGRSAGRAMDLGWYGDADVRAAVDLLAASPDVTGGIAVVGLSMGGEEAIGAAAADPRIAAVVAEGATARVAADKSWLVDAYGWRGRVQHALDVATYGLTDLLSPASQPRTLASAVHATRPRPLLLITAGSVPDERQAADRLAAQAPATTTVWTVPGAAHTGALRTDPSGWESRVVAFLQASLPGSGAGGGSD